MSCSTSIYLHIASLLFLDLIFFGDILYSNFMFALCSSQCDVDVYAMVSTIYAIQFDLDSILITL